MAQNRVKKMKIIVIGESGVGKSCLQMRYNGNDFAPVRATIGTSCSQKMLDIDGVKVNLSIWDTAGQERFRTVSPMYYRDCHGAILVYDVTDMKTMYMLESWLNELEMHCTRDNIAKMVVGNKIDESNLQQQEGISRTNEGLRFANRHHAMFALTSAKTNEGVKDAFEEVVRKIIQTDGLWDENDDKDAVALQKVQVAPAEESWCSC